MNKIIKVIRATHRVLGTILSILFLVWFLSGFVMIYHTFPRLKSKDKFTHMEALQGCMQPIDSVFAQTGDDITRLSLKMFSGSPFFEVNGKSLISADTSSQRYSAPTFNHIELYASRWSDAAIVRTDTLHKLEQWIPFGRMKKDLPIYKFYFGDKAGHQLYVSSVTGEALQFTNKNSRVWAWFGAIPHWVYFTFLRQNTAQWSTTLIWLSGVGCIMCLAGIVLGIWIYIKQYRQKKLFKSPYRKFAYKWHHTLGFVFGLFVLSFTFSGMMSMADLPQWIVKTHDSSVAEKLHARRQILPENYTLDYRKVLDTYPSKVKSIEWTSFGDLPLYKVVVEDSLVTLDASGNEVKTLLLDEQAVRKMISEFHGENISLWLMTEYDNYYIAKSRHLPLPVYKIEVDDLDRSVYYINPLNGNTRYLNQNAKARRWLYQGLHSFKFKFLVERPWLWNIVMWFALIGGTIVSITGVWLGYKYIKRKIKHIKKTKC